jgi:quaternary ammonium compound-resistance protein SugE
VQWLNVEENLAMPWIYLIVAGLFEIGWPVGLKLSQTPGRLGLGLTVAVVCMAASGMLLWLAQKTIPIGTAYAVWTGIGAAGTFTVGVLFYGDSASAMRLVSLGLIVAGIIGLKLAHGPG